MSVNDIAGTSSWKGLFSHVSERKMQRQADRLLDKMGFAKNDQSAADIAFAGQVGGGLAKAEKNYMDALKSGDESKIAMAQVVYQKAQRIMAGFSQIMQQSHSLIMSIIQNMR